MYIQYSSSSQSEQFDQGQQPQAQIPQQFQHPPVPPPQMSQENISELESLLRQSSQARLSSFKRVNSDNAASDLYKRQSLLTSSLHRLSSGGVASYQNNQPKNYSELYTPVQSLISKLLTNRAKVEDGLVKVLGNIAYTRRSLQKYQQEIVKKSNNNNSNGNGNVNNNNNQQPQPFNITKTISLRTSTPTPTPTLITTKKQLDQILIRTKAQFIKIKQQMKESYWQQMAAYDIIRKRVHKHDEYQAIQRKFTEQKQKNLQQQQQQQQHKQQQQQQLVKVIKKQNYIKKQYISSDQKNQSNNYQNKFQFYQLLYNNNSYKSEQKCKIEEEQDEEQDEQQNVQQQLQLQQPQNILSSSSSQANPLTTTNAFTNITAQQFQKLTKKQNLNKQIIVHLLDRSINVQEKIIKIEQKARIQQQKYKLRAYRNRIRQQKLIQLQHEKKRKQRVKLNNHHNDHHNDHQQSIKQLSYDNGGNGKKKKKSFKKQKKKSKQQQQIMIEQNDQVDGFYQSEGNSQQLDNSSSFVSVSGQQSSQSNKQQQQLYQSQKYFENQQPQPQPQKQQQQQMLQLQNISEQHEQKPDNNVQYRSKSSLSILPNSFRPYIMTSSGLASIAETPSSYVQQSSQLPSALPSPLPLPIQQKFTFSTLRQSLVENTSIADSDLWNRYISLKSHDFERENISFKGQPKEKIKTPRFMVQEFHTQYQSTKKQLQSLYEQLLSQKQFMKVLLEENNANEQTGMNHLQLSPHLLLECQLLRKQRYISQQTEQYQNIQPLQQFLYEHSHMIRKHQSDLGFWVLMCQAVYKIKTKNIQDEMYALKIIRAKIEKLGEDLKDWQRVQLQKMASLLLVQSDKIQTAYYVKKANQCFVKTFQKIYRLPDPKKFLKNLFVGAVMLKTPSCKISHNQSSLICPMCNPLAQKIFSQVPLLTKSQSNLICRINNSIMGEENYPVMLPSKQIYSIKGLQSKKKVTWLENGKKLQEYYCQVTRTWYKTDEAKKVFLA